MSCRQNFSCSLKSFSAGSCVSSLVGLAHFFFSFSFFQLMDLSWIAAVFLVCIRFRFYYIWIKWIWEFTVDKLKKDTDKNHGKTKTNRFMKGKCVYFRGFKTNNLWTSNAYWLIQPLLYHRTVLQVRLLICWCPQWWVDVVCFREQSFSCLNKKF